MRQRRLIEPDSPLLRDGVSAGSLNGDLVSGRSDFSSALGSDLSAGQFYKDKPENRAFARDTMSELFDKEEKTAVF